MATTEIAQALATLRQYVADIEYLGEADSEHAVVALHVIEQEVAKLHAPGQMALEYPRTKLEHCEDSLARQGQYLRDTLTKIADLVREAMPSEWEAIGTPNGLWTRQCLQEVLAIVDPPQEDGPTAEDLS